MGYPNINRLPDEVFYQIKIARCQTTRSDNLFIKDDFLVTVISHDDLFDVSVKSSLPLKRIILCWNCQGFDFPNDYIVFRDAFERSYGDCGWYKLSQVTYLPWYTAISDKQNHRCYGVQTGPSCFTYWRFKPNRIELILDVRNGSQGVLLGDRELLLCRYIQADYTQRADDALLDFCGKLCPNMKGDLGYVYGFNNWYYAYGRTNRELLEQDGKLLAELSKGMQQRPYCVVDDGWERSTLIGFLSNRFDCWLPKPTVGDMKALADYYKDLGLIPGLWFRPLLANAAVQPRRIIKRADPVSWFFRPLDPTIEQNKAYIKEMIERFKGWGFKLLKHDFSTFDLFGFFHTKGFDYRLTQGSWHFFDQTKTNAEIVKDLYTLIADTAEDMVIIGCNTISHLAAGIFELQRIGNDTSGRAWYPNVKNGVNTLAYRLCQHNKFYQIDADCCGIAGRVSWADNRKWLDLLGKSGTPCFVSADPRIITEEQKQAITAAFNNGANADMHPLKVFEQTLDKAPANWTIGEESKRIKWFRNRK